MADRVTRVGQTNTSNIPQNPATNETLLAVAGFVTDHFDWVGVTENADNDVMVYKHGGSGGTTVATVTVTYTSATKTSILNIAKT